MKTIFALMQSILFCPSPTCTGPYTQFVQHNLLTAPEGVTFTMYLMRTSVGNWIKPGIEKKTLNCVKEFDVSVQIKILMISGYYCSWQPRRLKCAPFHLETQEAVPRLTPSHTSSGCCSKEKWKKMLKELNENRWRKKKKCVQWIKTGVEREDVQCSKKKM